MAKPGSTCCCDYDDCNCCGGIGGDCHDCHCMQDGCDECKPWGDDGPVIPMRFAEYVECEEDSLSW